MSDGNRPNELLVSSCRLMSWLDYRMSACRLDTSSVPRMTVAHERAASTSFLQQEGSGASHAVSPVIALCSPAAGRLNRACIARVKH
jgi:hypothetical protein